jgi:hypothetical protein
MLDYLEQFVGDRPYRLDEFWKLWSTEFYWLDTVSVEVADLDEYEITLGRVAIGWEIADMLPPWLDLIDCDPSANTFWVRVTAWPTS